MTLWHESSTWEAAFAGSVGRAGADALGHRSRGGQIAADVGKSGGGKTGSRSAARRCAARWEAFSGAVPPALRAASHRRVDHAIRNSPGGCDDFRPFPAVLQQIDPISIRSLERLFEFLRIQSISTDPAYKDQCQAAAQYVAKDLSGIGFRPASVRPSATPLSWARATPRQRRGPARSFYGHYDVQPVDPLELREAPPFAPRIATLPGGRKIIVARGACDDKVQVMTFVEACRAFGGHGQLPVPITMMIEGEEDVARTICSASSGQRRRVQARPRAGLRYQHVGSTTPMVTTSLRGPSTRSQTHLRGPGSPFRLFGGAAQNPLRGSPRILAAT